MAPPTIQDSDRDDVRFSAGKMGINNLTNAEIDVQLNSAIGLVAERTGIPWTNTTDFYETRLYLWRLFGSIGVLKGKNSLVDARKSLMDEADRILNGIHRDYTQPEQRDDIYTVPKDYQSYPRNQVTGTMIYGSSRFRRRLGGAWRGG